MKPLSLFWKRLLAQFFAGVGSGLLGGIVGLIIGFNMDSNFRFAGESGEGASALLGLVLGIGLLSWLGVYLVGTLGQKIASDNWKEIFYGSAWGTLVTLVLFHFLEGGDHPISIVLLFIPLGMAIWDFNRMQKPKK